MKKFNQFLDFIYKEKASVTIISAYLMVWLVLALVYKK